MDQHPSRVRQPRGITAGAGQRPSGQVPGLRPAALVAPGQPLDRLGPERVGSLDVAVQRHGAESTRTRASLSAATELLQCSPLETSRGIRGVVFPGCAGGSWSDNLNDLIYLCCTAG